MTHQHVDWYIDWTTKQLKGSIVFDCYVWDTTDMFILDWIDITVDSVVMQPAGTAMRATMSQGNIPLSSTSLNITADTPNPEIGSRLIIDLPQNYSMGALFSVQVTYQTNAGGAIGV